MTSRSRITLHAIFLLALLLLPGLSRNAQAYPIENLVDIDWQNGAFKEEPVIFIENFTFMASLDDLDDITISFVLNQAADDVAGVQFILSVGTSFDAIEASATPFQLGYALGVKPTPGAPAFPFEVDENGQPLPFNPDGLNAYSFDLHLNQFHNYQQLVALMQNGAPLAFALGADLFGSTDAEAADGLACSERLPGDVCPSWPGLGHGSITVTGTPGPPGPPQTTVPEPSSLALLSIGGAIAAGVRRRRR